MLPFREPMLGQADFQARDTKGDGKVLKDCKKRACDVRMPHEASICIYTISISKALLAP